MGQISHFFPAAASPKEQIKFLIKFLHVPLPFQLFNDDTNNSWTRKSSETLSHQVHENLAYVLFTLYTRTHLVVHWCYVMWVKISVSHLKVVTTQTGTKMVLWKMALFVSA